MRANLAAFAAIATLACNVLTSEAADNDVTSIRAEIKHLSETYEARIAELESRLEKMETTEGRTVSNEGGVLQVQLKIAEFLVTLLILL